MRVTVTQVGDVQSWWEVLAKGSKGMFGFTGMATRLVGPWEPTWFHTCSVHLCEAANKAPL